MAFKFSQIEPVQFGDFVSKPVLTSEARLRLSQAQVTPDNLEDAAQAIAECFGEDSTKVKTFLDANPIMTEYSKLQVYLLQGEKGLRDLEERAKTMMDEQIAKNLEEASSHNA